MFLEKTITYCANVFTNGCKIYLKWQKKKASQYVMHMTHEFSSKLKLEVYLCYMCS